MAINCCPIVVSTCLSLVLCAAASAEPDPLPTPVAELFGTPIMASEIEPDEAALGEAGESGIRPADAKLRLMAENLERRIFQALLGAFVKQHGLKAEKHEIDAAFAALTHGAASSDGEPIPKDAQRKTFEEMVISWKASKALYEKYGGTVIFQQFNPLEPVGAYRRLIEDSEKKGVFKVLDRRLTPLMWTYFTREDHPFQVPKEEIDFTVPWWLRRPPGEAVEGPVENKAKVALRAVAIAQEAHFADFEEYVPCGDKSCVEKLGLDNSVLEPDTTIEFVVTEDKHGFMGRSWSRQSPERIFYWDSKGGGMLPEGEQPRTDPFARETPELSKTPRANG